jgi:hypothetical protein
MTVGSFCILAVARLRRAGVVIKKFFRPLESTDSPEPAESRKLVATVSCVWYGRAVFCMHYPLSYPLVEIDTVLDIFDAPQVSNASDVGDTAAVASPPGEAQDLHLRRPEPYAVHAPARARVPAQR